MPSLLLFKWQSLIRKLMQLLYRVSGAHYMEHTIDTVHLNYLQYETTISLFTIYNTNRAILKKISYLHSTKVGAAFFLIP